MRRRITIASAAVVSTAALSVGGAVAVGGGHGLVFDDGHYVRPGSLDDGKNLLPQTTISLETAVARAQQAASGSLGQVDLEQAGGRFVYVVDVGDDEVRVDANDGSVASVGPH